MKKKLSRTILNINTNLNLLMKDETKPIAKLFFVLTRVRSPEKGHSEKEQQPKTLETRAL